MKKIAVILMALSLTLLGACGSEEPEEEPEENEEVLDTTRPGSGSTSGNPAPDSDKSAFEDEEEVEEEESSLDPVEDHSGGVDENDEEKESAEDYSVDGFESNDTRDSDEVYEDAKRYVESAMHEEGYPLVHVADREFANISQQVEDTYLVSGNLYTNLNELFGSYTLDISYSDDGGVDYEWKVDYKSE